MSDSKVDDPGERPHGHRDRGRTDEGPHKDDGDSSERTQGPDPVNPEGNDTAPAAKGR